MDWKSVADKTLQTIKTSGTRNVWPKVAKLGNDVWPFSDLAMSQFCQKLDIPVRFEFQIVPRGPGHGRRLVDAVILPQLPFAQAHWRDISLEGRDVIVVQAKAHRLGMYLMASHILGRASQATLCPRKAAISNSVFQG